MKPAPFCSLTLLLLLPATAWAWPASGDWDALTQGGLDMVDNEVDQANAAEENAWDIIGNSANPAVRWYLDDSNIYVRMLLNDDPANLVPSYSGSWGVLLETDGDTTTYEYSVALASRGGYFYLYRNTDAGTGVDETAEEYLGSVDDPMSSDLALLTNIGVVLFGDYGEAWLDLTIPLETLYDHEVIDSSTSFQLCVVSSTDGDGDYFDADAAGVDNGKGMGDLADCLADAVSVDGDADGLHWFEEIDEHGTDPALYDTDKDGIGDGDEAACELGGDSDDRDGDGIPDADEGADDPDKDGQPNFCDEDSDGDGLSDAEEGTGDADCDGLADFLDAEDDDACDTGEDTGPGDDTGDTGPGDDTGDTSEDSGEAEDTGDTGLEDKDPGGAACAVSGATLASALLAMMALPALRRRRRGAAD